MSKIIERIVKSGGSPGENDLWLKKDSNGDLSLNAFDNGEWKEIAGGGSGGSVDGAVSYNEQTLTEEQQMQARKNQGLYYTEGEGEKEVIFDVTCDDEASIPDLPLMGLMEAVSNTYGEIMPEGYEYAKVQDAAPNVEEISSYVCRYVSTTDESENVERHFSIEDAFIHQGVGWYGVLFTDSSGDGNQFIVVTDDTADVDCIFEFTDVNSPWYYEGEEPIIINNVSKGVWMVIYVFTNDSLDTSNWELAYMYPGDVITQTLTYGSSTVMAIPSEYVQAVSYSEEQALTQPQKMQARLNQDLYAKNPDTNINLSWEWDGSDDVDNLVFVRGWGSGTHSYYYKIADDNLPDLSAVIHFVYTSVINDQVYTRYPAAVNDGEFSWTVLPVGSHPFGNWSELLSGTMYRYQPGEDDLFLIFANEASVRLETEDIILMNGLYVYATTSTNTSNYSYVSNVTYTIPGEVINPVEPEYQKPYVVRFTTSQNYEIECSATYDEIQKAFDTGAVIIGEYYDRNGELISKTRNVSVGSYYEELS